MAKEMKYTRESLTLKDMRKGKWNKKGALRVVAPRAERFFDCGYMGEWEARFAIAGVVVGAVVLTAVILMLNQPPM